MEKHTRTLHYIVKSKFVRSVFLRVLSIFLIVSIAIVAIVFISFSSEINRNIIQGKQQQLAVIEDTISKRMDEISSIAYNVGTDPIFYLEPVSGTKYTGYEMSNTLAKYLVGNSFIEYMAYYRLSEPDKIYTSRGELAFSDFWSTYMGLDQELAVQYTQYIQAMTKVQVATLDLGGSGRSFFSYICPLPQFSKKPQAFVLILIPVSEVAPLFDTQLMTSRGAVAVFDADGNEIYRQSTLDEDIAIDPAAVSGNGEKETYITVNGMKYVVQKQVSGRNGWTYVSIIQLKDIISGLASKQILFIALLLILMFVAIFTMLLCIIIQYKPIETAYQEAEAANKAKSAFLSSMSHDIRTPMNAIIGMTAIANKHADDPAYVRECLQKVEIASRYLLDIINNVLDMSRIESGRFTLSEETVDLPMLIYSLITIISPSVEAKGQRFIVDAEGVHNEKVTGDILRLTQVFVNILSNAVKFTPEGGTITLSMQEAASSDPNSADYVFAVSDTGIGMSQEFVAQVFDTFSRAEAADASRVEGTGLGMAIAKNLVELMGGTIACQSEPGNGTTFTVRLRLKLASATPVRELLSKECRSARVLIVGNERICRAQAGVFDACGLTRPAEWASDAAQAEKLCARARAAGQAYRLILINASDDDPHNQLASAISAACASADTHCVLATRDPIDMRLAGTEQAGLRAVIQLPLFESTARRLLEGRFGDEEPRELRGSGIPLLTGRRILIVEDNAVNREIARKIIRETGADIEEAVDGQEALDTFTRHEAGYFDLILMDLQMPVLDGYAATAAIRALPRADAPVIPIYAMTASTFSEDVRQVRKAGMNGHVGKPYTPEALYAVLRKVMHP